MTQVDGSSPRDAEPPPPDGLHAESCNGADDDGDGLADEGLGLGGVCEGPFECGVGAWECDGEGGLRCSSGPGGSASGVEPERCNGADDDCDGATDEGLGIGEPCEAPGLCEGGDGECGPDGRVICSSAPGGSLDRSADEVCNGLDDDCDGSVDEDSDCGDICAEAVPLEPHRTFAGDTADLNDRYPRGNCLGDTAGPDQLLRFDVPDPGPYLVGVAPMFEDHDPLFWIASGCDAAERASCSHAGAFGSEEGAGRPEASLINFIRGGRHILLVDSRDGPGGAYWATVAPAHEGETCEGAIPLSVPADYVSTTARRQGDASISACTGGAQTVGPDLYFRVRLEQAGRLRLSAHPDSRVRVALAVVADCAAMDDTCVAGAVAEEAGETVRLDVELEPGDWTVVIDHPTNTGGAFVLSAALDL